MRTRNNLILLLLAMALSSESNAFITMKEKPIKKSKREQIALNYFEHFVNGRVGKVLELFGPEGRVFFKEWHMASDFYPESKDFIAQIEFRVKDTFYSSDTGNVTVNFEYLMPTAGGDQEEQWNEALDLIHFDEIDKISSVMVFHLD